MAQRDFWTADVKWESEPNVGELRRLNYLLSTDSNVALKGLRALSEQGSLAATLCIAIHLDRALPPGSSSDEVVNWYQKAAEWGSRAALYQLGVKQSEMARWAEAERSFGRGAERDFPPCLYRLARLYIDRRPRSAENDILIDDLLRRGTRAHHIYCTRDYMLRSLSGRRGIHGFMEGLVLIPIFWLRFANVMRKAIAGDEFDETIYA